MAKTFSGKEAFETKCYFFGIETEKAVKVEINKEEMWLPLSAIHKMVRPAGGSGEGSIVIDLWLAQKRGLV